MIDTAKMPKLGFGMMRLPQVDGKPDVKRVSDMVDAYMKAGLNYFDTAYIYHGGDSERVIKEALVDRYPRESFMLTDKLPVWVMKEDADKDKIFQDQLDRTGAGYFDIYLLHSVEDGANYDGYVKYDAFNWAMEKKKAGLIKHFGFSYHGTPELLDQILTEHPEVEVVQIQLNYADWENPVVQSGRLYEVLTKHQKPILIMEPVKGGSLAQLVPQIEEMYRAERPESSMASWALRFAASLPGVMTVLSGMSTEEQMADNIATFTSFEPLSEHEKEVVEKARKILTAMKTVPCTACRYCVDGCPAQIEIPEVFRALNTVRIYGNEHRPHMFYDGLMGRSGRAGDCLHCGQCEGVCPQHLPIIELLEEASGIFDKQ